MPILKVPGEISTALGYHLNGQRVIICRVLEKLRDQLENHYEDYKTRRNKDDQNLFDYCIRVRDSDNKWHTLWFAIDDSMAAGYLLIVDLSHKLD